MAQQFIDQTGQEREDYRLAKINVNFSELYGKFKGSGTFTLNGTTPVTVADTTVTANSSILITLKTVGGTVGAKPAVKTITPGTGFTVAGTASDTSVYNYAIIN